MLFEQRHFFSSLISRLLWFLNVDHQAAMSRPDKTKLSITHPQVKTTEHKDMFGGANWCFSMRHLTSGPHCNIVLNLVVICPSVRLVYAAVVMDPVASPLSIYSLPSSMFLVDWHSIAYAAFALGCAGPIQATSNLRQMEGKSWPPLLIHVIS